MEYLNGFIVVIVLYAASAYTWILYPVGCSLDQRNRIDNAVTEVVTVATGKSSSNYMVYPKAKKVLHIAALDALTAFNIQTRQPLYVFGNLLPLFALGEIPQLIS